MATAVPSHRNGIAGERVYLARLYARILDDVEQGRDVLLMFPKGADVSQHLENIYRLAAGYLRVGVLSDRCWRWVTRDTSPEGSPLRVQLLLSGDAVDPEADVDLWVLGPGAISPPLEPSDASAPQRWQAPSVTIEVQPPRPQRPAAVIPVYASEWPARVPGSVHLSVRPLWGCTGWGDMYQLATSLLDDGEETSYALWATSVWVELAGADEALLRELIERRIPPPGWRAFLQEYAMRRGWQGEALRMAEEVLLRAFPWHTLSLTHSDRPSAWLLRLWAEGMVDLLPDRGIEVHSALLVALKWERLLYHRIWRGQVYSLFPLIDQARLLIARECGRHGSGEDAVGSSAKGGELRDEEWSYPPSLRDVVSDLKLARNRLAHYEPLEWDTYRLVVAALYRLERRILPTHLPRAMP